MPIFGTTSSAAIMPPVIKRKTSGSGGSGNVDVSATNYGTVDSALDITLPARAGDVLHMGASFVCGSGSNNLETDFVTVVSGSTVNYCSSTGSSGAGMLGAYMNSNEGAVNSGLSGDQYYTVQSGDVSSGTVTLRFVAKNSTGAQRQIITSATIPLTVWARNTTGSFTLDVSRYLAHAELFSGTSASLGKADTTATALDSTNLKLEFNWPVSGAALFEFSGSFTYARPVYLYLATSAAASTPLRYIAYLPGADSTGMVSARSKLTGTPGTAASIVIGWEGAAGAGTSQFTHGANGSGPLTFTAIAL